MLPMRSECVVDQCYVEHIKLDNPFDMLDRRYE